MADDPNVVQGQPETVNVTANQPESSPQPVMSQIPNKIPNVNVPPAPQQPQATATPTPPEDHSNHPLVRRAGILRAIGEKLAGFQTDPNTNEAVTGYKRDLDTGELQPVKRRLKGSEIGMGIVAAALMGALGGAGQRGPGAAARGFGMGGQAVMQKRQQEEQQQKEQADKDFASHYSALEANMRMMNNAIDLGRKEREDHQSMVDSYAPMLAQYTEDADFAGKFIKGTQLSEADAKDVKKYPFNMLRVPDGVVPRLDNNGNPVYISPTGRIVNSKTPGAHQAWDNTYTILDKSAPINLKDEDGNINKSVKMAIDWGLLPVSLTQSGNTETVPASVLINPVHQAVALNELQNDLNAFNTELKNEPVDLKKIVAGNRSLLQASQDFQRASHYSTQPDIIIDKMRQDPKVKPDSVKQMMNLFGSDNLEKFKLQRENTEAKNKSQGEAAGKIAAESTPEALAADKQKKEAEAKARIDAEANSPKGRAELTHLQLENKGLQDTQAAEDAIQSALKNTSSADVVNGVNNKFLNALPSDLYGVVKSIGEGRTSMSPRNLASKYGLEVQKAVNNAYPGYDFTRADSYERAKRDFTSGPTSQMLQAFSTALGHLERLSDHATVIATTPVVKGIAAALGNKDAAALQDDKTFITEEVAKAYRSGVADKDTIGRINDLLNAGPMSIHTHIPEIARLLGGQFDSMNNKWNNAVPSSFVNPIPDLISPKAQAAYKKLTGEDLQLSGRSISGNQSQPVDTNIAKVPVGKVPGKDASGKIVGYADDNKGTNYVSF